MLPRSKRIPRQLFSSILESRKYSNTRFFTLRASFSSDDARAAVSVSKKVSKKAVIRNKVRRRAYSAIRELLPSLKPGLYLFIAKPGAEKLKVEEMKGELSELIRLMAN